MLRQVGSSSGYDFMAEDCTRIKYSENAKQVYSGVRLPSPIRFSDQYQSQPGRFQLGNDPRTQKLPVQLFG